MSHGNDDIIYHFVISKFGVFEARGWKAQRRRPIDATSVLKENVLSIGIINDDADFYASKKLTESLFLQLVQDGKVLGKIAPNCVLNIVFI